MGDLTKNFNRWEFSCKCGCGFNRIDPELVNQIQRLRDLLWVYTGKEIPITVTSGCRCPDHNAAVGGTRNSFHTLKLAVDIIFKRIPVMFAGRIAYLANQLDLMKVGGIGVYPDRNFLHLDIRPQNISTKGTSPTTWINENGFYRYGIDFSKEINAVSA
jgi:hypothetical protein